LKYLFTIIAVCALQQMQPLRVQAALQPQEIAILVVRGSRESERLAEYYAEQRGIPTENICQVVMPRGETISREKWRWAIRPEIRKWLQDHDPQQQLRCLVTTWDVPLRIGRDKQDSPTLSRYQEYLEGERAKRIQLLHDLVAQFGLLAPGNSPRGAATGADSTTRALEDSESTEVQQLQKLLEKELQAAQARIRKLPDSQQRQRASAQLQHFAMAVGGIQILLESLQKQLPSDTEVASPLRSNFERLRGMLIAYTELQQQLTNTAPSIERDSTLLNILSRARGVIASIGWLDEQLKTITKNETNSSFDSELSLVLWPDDYPLLRWLPNYLRPEYKNSQLRDSYRTMMVARLDAPTLKLAKGLIDTAIQIEKQGLQGKVYLDARGIGKLDQSKVSPGSYADYDRALLITAQGLKEKTTLEVTLDKKGELFQPGDCPDAALYCGWYSLGKYVDAFDWAPGAVAYHLASGEATTLRNLKSQVWCKRMLEEGVCATIGPVYEPYLVAFPRPNEFFALLIQGELSLVECYYQTKPFNGWMMTLIGDPLYRPFANRNVQKTPSQRAQEVQK